MLDIKEPRKTDIPEVKPLQWDVKAGNLYVNNLHQVMGDVLECLTGNLKLSSKDLLEFIQINYKQLFGNQ